MDKATERKKMIEKIRAMMDKARSSNSPAESATAFALARKLMLKHKLDAQTIEEYEVIDAISVEHMPYVKMNGVKRHTKKYVEYLAAMVAKMFNVRILIDHVVQYNADGTAKLKKARKNSRYTHTKVTVAELLVIGTPENREIFKYVFDSLVNQCFVQCETAQLEGELDGSLEFVSSAKEADELNAMQNPFEARTTYVERRMYIADFYKGFAVAIKERVDTELRQDSEQENAIVALEMALVNQYVDENYNAKSKTVTTRAKDSGGEKAGRKAGQNANMTANGINSGSKIAGYLN